MVLWEHEFPINPVPASRPRVAKWGTYYGKRYTQFKDEYKKLTDSLKDKPVLQGPLSVQIICSVQKPKTSKLTYPNGDIDNYEKAVLDGLNGVVWEDDKQIVELWSQKEFSSEPCIYVCVSEWVES